MRLSSQVFSRSSTESGSWHLTTTGIPLPGKQSGLKSEEGQLARPKHPGDGVLTNPVKQLRLASDKPSLWPSQQLVSRKQHQISTQFKRTSHGLISQVLSGMQEPRAQIVASRK